MKVRNKIIVVTDGGSGMGREIVLRLLEKDAIVAIADSNKYSMAETIKHARNLASN